jgi:hypothetical protein
MKPWQIVTGGCLLPIVLIGGCCCYALFYNQSVWDQNEVVGVRKNAQGQVVSQVILRTTWARRGPLPGPHGPGMVSFDIGRKVFLYEGGQYPGRELTFFRDAKPDPFQWTKAANPVEGSRLWVVEEQPADDGHHQPIELVLLVFDDTHIVRRRHLDRKCDWHHSELYARFFDGNRTIVYPTSDGFAAYDVIADTATPWKEPPAPKKGR